MKIVLDTNVLVSGIYWGGLPHKILDHWINNHIDVIVTKDILDEYARVIRKIGGDSLISEKWIVFIVENSILIQEKNIVKICRDPFDDMFINCAIAGNARYIVSGDKDLLSIKQFDKIQIVRVSEFLKII